MDTAYWMHQASQPVSQSANRMHRMRFGWIAVRCVSFILCAYSMCLFYCIFIVTVVYLSPAVDGLPTLQSPLESGDCVICIIKWNEKCTDSYWDSYNSGMKIHIIFCIKLYRQIFSYYFACFFFSLFLFRLSVLFCFDFNASKGTLFLASHPPCATRVCIKFMGSLNFTLSHNTGLLWHVPTRKYENTFYDHVWDGMSRVATAQLRHLAVRVSSIMFFIVAAKKRHFIQAEA